MKPKLKFYFLSIFMLGAAFGYSQQILPGAARFSKYVPLLKGEKVAIVANPTSKVDGVFTLDTLLKQGVDIVKIFSPEHGFRGKSNAGQTVKNGKDKKTGLPIISLYGKNKKPTKTQMKGLDWVIYDIQDVGVRFYTYISTLQLVMESCAENHVQLMLLDRPDPLGYYVAGPVLDTAHYRSFVGMQPIPVVYGMTPGEYAEMLNGEHWLKGHETCKLTVIKCKNYNHNLFYKLPVKPSPNLPNMTSIYLYPSLCFFEGTVVNVGRGTNKQFQVFGHPELKNIKGTNFDFSYIPQPNAGSAHPKLQGEKCYGIDLSDYGTSFMKGYKQLYLYWLVNVYKLLKPKLKGQFFTKYFNLLAGNGELKQQIIDGKSIKQIKASWQPKLNHFMQIRKKYLLYPDFRND